MPHENSAAFLHLDTSLCRWRFGNSPHTMKSSHDDTKLALKTPSEQGFSHQPKNVNMKGSGSVVLISCTIIQYSTKYLILIENFI